MKYINFENEFRMLNEILKKKEYKFLDNDEIILIFKSKNKYILYRIYDYIFCYYFCVMDVNYNIDYVSIYNFINLKELI